MNVCTCLCKKVSQKFFCFEYFCYIQIMEKNIQRIRGVVANDPIAISYQSMGQYRTMLLKEIDQVSEKEEPELKIYIYTGPGHYIGSLVVVLAKSKRRAKTMIKKQLVSMGLANEEIEDLQEIELKPGMIYAESGDY